jgi:cell division transport system permease protein
MKNKVDRIFETTYKDLKRNKTMSLSSIVIMTLVFLVFSTFTISALVAAQFLNYVETREHIEVFFNTDVDEAKILEIKESLESTGKTTYVEYTTQEQAAAFLRERHSDNPLILGAINAEALPASLAIRAKKIDYVSEINSTLLSQDPNNELIYKIGYNEDTTNLIKDLLFWVRLLGAVLFVFLVGVIFLVSLIAVEISISSRIDEISIMQLVGGGKWYIRAPFILQGAVYGLAGALIAGLVLSGLGVAVHFLKDQSPTLTFLSNFFADLNLPAINWKLVLIFLGGEILLGTLTGSLNSLIAVLRRLK